MRTNYFHRCFYSFVILVFASCTQNNKKEQSSRKDTTVSSFQNLFASDVWTAPDSNLIPQNDSGKMIRYGKSLIEHTSEYLGPKGSVGHLSKGMNCQNCHLDAGTKPYGNNFSAVASTYPKFKPRLGNVESIEKKVSDCFERSLNGNALDASSKEMRAIVSYIKWLGTNVKKGEIPKGAGLVEVPFLNRAADPEKGKIVFIQKCISCHGNDGQGIMNADEKSYLYPPLWGEHSYNIGASLYRLSRFAGYVRANMPLVTSSENPPLSDEQAWDVAAFVNSMQRTGKKFREDWPDISKKPYDYPYGPYADQFSELQHKFGPFAEIPAAKKKK